MIRLAEEQDFLFSPWDELSTRLLSAVRAYGCGKNYLLLYTDGVGSYLSVMNGYAVYYSHEDTISDEWLLFISMNPSVKTVRCSKKAGEILSRHVGHTVKYGDSMIYHTSVYAPTAVNTVSPNLEKLYELLSHCFPDFAAFDGWYVDVSHRLRHGMCRIASVTENGRVISSAMTVAQLPESCVIGAVATLPEKRGKGLASACVLELARAFSDRPIYISPVSETAKRIYEKCGFSVCGNWCEIHKKSAD